MNKKTIIILAIVLIVVLGVAAIFVFGQNQSTLFTQEKWQDMQQRELIVDNLIDSKRLIGMNEQQVKELLGTEYIQIDNSWIYITTYQPEGVYLQVLERLYVEFENGIVTNCYTKIH